ncbi:Crp/Fnr family transcriptional regulator [Rhodoferax sp.]|uniref:Crp/Fnr family transcriptional regulator n=1 Tax=Rhodoferax sp. TaxID=50421 RepID=UPI00275E0C06|nr:Crp/Fnr family transcriptional regulator [Rhodoferax sp.]
MFTNKSTLPKAAASIQSRHFKRAQRVHQIGDQGQAWYVQSGAVRLDAMSPEGLTFAALAVTGDIIGTDALVGGRYAFAARALTPCVLTPWELSQSTPVLELMSAAQRRAAEVVALRCGRAEDRVARLVRLLGSDGVQRHSDFRVLTPRLRDVADITNLAPETVSRIANATQRSH